jgi:hypothetical protein
MAKGSALGFAGGRYGIQRLAECAGIVTVVAAGGADAAGGAAEAAGGLLGEAGAGRLGSDAGGDGGLADVGAGRAEVRSALAEAAGSLLLVDHRSSGGELRHAFDQQRAGGLAHRHPDDDGAIGMVHPGIVMPGVGEDLRDRSRREGCQQQGGDPGSWRDG